MPLVRRLPVFLALTGNAERSGDAIKRAIRQPGTTRKVARLVTLRLGARRRTPANKITE